MGGGDAFGDVAAKLATGFAQIGQVLRHHAWQGAGSQGVTPTQAQILTLLASAPTGLRLNDLAKRLAVTQATASDAVSTLVRKELVDKVRDEGDGRAVQVTLTAAGRTMAEAVAIWPPALLTAVAGLSDDEQAVMLRGLIKVIGELQRQGEVPVARVCVTCAYFRPHVHAPSAQPHHCALIDAPLADAGLQVDCPDHLEADDAGRERAWQVFRGGAG